MSDLSTPDQFYDWNPGDAPLPAARVAATLRWLKAAIQAGGALTDVEVSEDGRSLRFVTADGPLPSHVDLPAAPWDWKIEGRVVGQAYDPGDMFYVEATRSSYVTLAAHTAGADLDLDLAAHRLALVAKGGKDAQTYQGAYALARAYSKGDIVQTGAYGVDATLWQAFDDVPAGQAPGSDYRWGRVSLTQQRDVSARWRGAIAVGDAVLSHMPARGVSYNLAFAQSVAKLTPAPAAAVAFDVKVDGTVVGTLTFAAGTGAPTWTTVTTSTFGGFVAPGSVLEVVAKNAVAAAATVLLITIFGF